MLSLVGSLRNGSFNRALLREAVERLPSGAAHRSFDPRPLPFYDGDLETAGDPPSVAELKAEIHAADLVLLVTPEYNGGTSGVLKNALDWGSRPPRPQAWSEKPVAIMGATPGNLGTALAQRSLRESLAGLGAYVMPQPRILVSGAGRVFDADLRLADASVGERLTRFVEAAVGWGIRFQGSPGG